MIWVMAGTQDGREAAMMLAEERQETVLVSVVSSYGAALASVPGLEVYTGRLNQAGMVQMIQEKGISLLVDASHPYAAVATETAMLAAKEAGIPYIRYERAETPLPFYDKLYRTQSEAEAAEVAGKLASTLNKKVYLTTGSKTLPIFKKATALAEMEVWTRVLPTSEVLRECEELGFTPKYVVAVQGPFSYAMNHAMFKDTEADVVVMKNSGLVGGSDTKFEAAMDLGLHIVVIDRPEPSKGALTVQSKDELRAAIQEERWLK